MLRRQVEQLRKDNARYRHYEEVAVRLKEQLEVKEEVLSRLVRRSERTAGDMEEQLGSLRAKEERAAREVGVGHRSRRAGSAVRRGREQWMAERGGRKHWMT